MYMFKGGGEDIVWDVGVDFVRVAYTYRPLCV